MADRFDPNFPKTSYPSDTSSDDAITRAEEEMVRRQMRTGPSGPRSGFVPFNPEREEFSREMDERRRLMPGVASAPTVRDLGPDLNSTKSGLSVSTMGHLAQALEKARITSFEADGGHNVTTASNVVRQFDPLVQANRQPEAKEPKTLALMGPEPKDPTEEVTHIDGAKPVETGEVVADQKVPLIAQQNIHQKKMEAEVEVDEVEPEPTKPHHSALGVPDTLPRKVLKARVAKAAAWVQENAIKPPVRMEKWTTEEERLKEKEEVAVYEMTTKRIDLPAFGIEDREPHWSKELIERNRASQRAANEDHEKEKKFQAQMREMSEKLSALSEENKSLMKFISDGMAYREPAKGYSSRPTTEDFERTSRVSYLTPMGISVPPPKKIQEATTAKEARKQGVWRTVELSNPQAEQLQSKRDNILKDEELLRREAVVLRAVEKFGKNMPEEDKREMDELLRQLKSCNEVTQMQNSKLQHEIDSSEAMAKHYSPSLEMPDIYEYTEWTHASSEALRAKTIKSAIPAFNPEVSPEQDFADTWRQVLLHTAQFKLDDKAYRHILTVIMQGSSSRILYDMLQTYSDVGDIVQALGEMYSRRRTIVDDMTALNNFKRLANESIITCMQRATMMAVRVRHIYPPEVWEKSKRKEILMSILRQVVTTETKRHIEYEELKYLKVGAQMTYKAMLDLVETFEAANAQIPKVDRELMINVSSGSPKDISTTSKEVQQITGRMDHVDVNSGALTEAPRPVRRAMNRVKSALQSLGVSIDETDVLKKLGEHQRSHSPFKRRRSGERADSKSPNDLADQERFRQFQQKQQQQRQQQQSQQQQGQQQQGQQQRQQQQQSHSSQDNRLDNRGRERYKPPPRMLQKGNVGQTPQAPQAGKTTFGNPGQQGQQGQGQQPWNNRGRGGYRGRGGGGYRGGNSYVNNRQQNFNGNQNNYQKQDGQNQQQPQWQRNDNQNYQRGGQNNYRGNRGSYNFNRGNYHNLAQGPPPGYQPMYGIPMYPPQMMIPMVPPPQVVTKYITCRNCKEVHAVNSFCPVSGQKVTLNSKDL